LAPDDTDKNKARRRRKSRKPDTQSVGWRLKQIRLRRGLTQVDLARLAGISNSQVSRLELAGPGGTRPKPSSLERVLGALGVSGDERAALFHVEAPPPSPQEIFDVVRRCAAEYERSDRAIGLLDEHRFIWYFNATARAAQGLTPGRYWRLIGEHTLTAVVDPASPMYGSYPPQEREALFSMRAAAFKQRFAREQFSRWYMRVVQRVRRYEWAARAWDNPSQLPTYLDNQLFLTTHHTLGDLHLDAQYNTLLRDPRFGLLELTPRDSASAERLAVITFQLSSYEYAPTHPTPDDLIMFDRAAYIKRVSAALKETYR
jgi:transcriptional regulator with XRE-family HTH domain